MKKKMTPSRIFVAMLLSLLTAFCPYVLHEGNPFHHFTVYDEYFFLALVVYILGFPATIWLVGSAHMKINRNPESFHGKKAVFFAYALTAASFLIPQILMIIHRIMKSD